MPRTPSNIAVHNLSSFTLTQPQLNLLNKGLSFTPTRNFTLKDHFNLHKYYNQFGDSIRMSANNMNDLPTHQDTNYNSSSTDELITPFIFRRMKFLKNQQDRYIPPATFQIENYIHCTKDIVDENRSTIFQRQKPNVTKEEYKAILTLKQSTAITVKPADKNLGIALLNTNDYVQQCVSHLKSSSYQRVREFPTQLQKQLENCIIKFKEDICQYSQLLYKYLIPSQQHRIPRFYGLPKLHKPPTLNNIVPPIRPIVSHVNSLLSPSAKFIDHVLQPLARSYCDYLHNSTELVHHLMMLKIPEETTLVCLDIVSLFPSIPQTECLQVLCDEMNTHKELLLFNPNLILQLLNINIFNNYFEFSETVFQQTTGIAMGAAFSPTIANIFMSVFIRRFLLTTTEQPLHLSRYIDDIFLIWPNQYNLETFITSLNNFHPNIKFTVTSSRNKINFLDLTIYKGHNFTSTNTLDVKTFQKPNSLYQYLHYDSFHPKTTFKGTIIGECIRYARTNTEEANYNAQVALLKTRLLNRNYPLYFINKNIARVNYHHRTLFIRKKLKPTLILTRPIFKCLPPPNFKHLKYIILSNYQKISHLVRQPLFVSYRHKTLGNSLVRSRHDPTIEDKMLINDSCPFTTAIIQTPPPKQLNLQTPSTKKCNARKCATCQHINESTSFKSTTTKRTYRIREYFTCSSKNIIYLITCSKCKKQYVGQTRKNLRERINHHRSTIMCDKTRYLSIHFNFPDHNITNLKVQVIDTTTPDKLITLEKYWIETLQTVQPKGLNCIM